MKILAYNAGHDGSAVLLQDETLRFCLEAEKDSGSRHALISPNLFIRSLELAGLPDAIAISGWHSRSNDLIARSDASYMGTGSESLVQAMTTLMGKSIAVFHSSHERSHIMCSYGLAPFPQGQPCYVLVWEGKIGAFYYVDEQVRIHPVGEVLAEPGSKYAFLYGLADPTVPMFPTSVRMEDAGKLMALAAHGAERVPSNAESELIQAVMSMPSVYGGSHFKAHKAKFKSSPFCNVGLRSQEFKDVAWQFSAALFDRFLSFARTHLQRKLPLLIAGGCGLNCDWNSKWLDCGLFEDVFVPPCTNDSGVALGAAIDAAHAHIGRAKVDWNVYAGEEFVDDLGAKLDVSSVPLNLDDVCRQLRDGAVIAWVQGRYEMGPRALGNRSLLAAPFSAETRDRLNHIKQREEFRPIAPICLQEDFQKHFQSSRAASPHMLYFQRVMSSSLAAITHVDGSARAQTVTSEDNPRMHDLLLRFRQLTGYGVLCNTSLNFKGAGFINRMSDLIAYARERELDGFVVGERFYML
ncbi:carbamoyltransferase C-terminal domain-containing protein [Steroidobacter cummioxidans]|uniref:carbamoyltransferase C-terminal domain-containing protein n=1 Tax=Steroidobacter cummioxidans TaxID=1803913 RepID=UPI000E317891|nr:carbamoyltransferase C-terminal domain-containing protein [Steroidobacter cummioxidans]